MLSTTGITRATDGLVDEAAEPRPDADSPTDASSQPSARSRWTVRRVGVLLAPALIYLGIRELGLLFLSWLIAVNQNRIVVTNVADALRSWDGQWFLNIAASGYDGVPADLVDANGLYDPDNALAFFPGYPTVVGWVAGIDGSRGIGVGTAALTVTIISGVICAYGLARIGRQIAGGSLTIGLILVALFAASPMSVVLSMAYSEAMFCAFAAWALVGVLERRWVLAGTCCGLAGLVRPTAAALILAVGLAALVAVINRRDSWRPWVAGVLAPAGLIGYLAWVGVRTGEWNGWFALQQRGWSSGFDGGVATVKFSIEAVGQAKSILEVSTVAIMVVALILLVIGFAQRVEWPLMVYAAGVLAMDLASNGLMNSKIRLMVPAFTLLLPVALALAKRRTQTALIVLGALAVASSWFGAYALTVWIYAI